MVRVFRHYVSPIKLGLAATDFILILICTILAEILRYSFLEAVVPLQDVAGWIAKLIVPIICLPILIGVGVYQADSLSDFKVFWIRMATGLLGAALVLSAVLFLFPILPLWRSILLLDLILISTALLASHGVFMRFGSGVFFAQRVLLLGAGKTAKNLMDYTRQSTGSGLNIVSVVALPNEDTAVEGAVRFQEIGSLTRFVSENHIEMIIVTGDATEEQLPLEALIACKLAGVTIKDRLACYEEIRGYVDIASVKAEWIIFSDGFKGATGLEQAAKRLMDLCISLVFGALVSPIMLISAILIKITSCGPVFYLQDRVGLNGEIFRLVKFRSMKVDAEQGDGPKWAEEKDPRITKVGAFIRRTRIDELPQLWNVFWGDMSFVGPRPERPFFVEKLKKDIAFYRERHCVKPGMTGWAQIRYPYGASVEDARRKLEYDLYYIKNYSLFLDLLIMLQTARVILFPTGVR